MKKILLLLFLSVSVLSLSAQKVYNSSGRKVPRKPVKQKGFNRDNLVLGGDFRFSLGSQISVGIAPIAGYKLRDNFFAGVRLGYSFDRIVVDYKYLAAGANTNIFKANSYSASVWARYLFMESIFLQTELEYNIFDTYYPNDLNGLYERITIESPSVLIGLGFRQPFSDRVTFNTTILFDVLNDPYSYYKLSGKGGFDLRFGLLVGF